MIQRSLAPTSSGPGKLFHVAPDLMVYGFTTYDTHTRASVPVVVWAFQLSANC
jgi:hypothetical protein